MNQGENLHFPPLSFVQPGIISPLAPEDVKEALHAAPRLEEALLGLPEGVALQAHLGAGEHVLHLTVSQSFVVHFKGALSKFCIGAERERFIKVFCCIANDSYFQREREGTGNISEILSLTILCEVFRH